MTDETENGHDRTAALILGNIRKAELSAITFAAFLFAWLGAIGSLASIAFYRGQLSANLVFAYVNMLTSCIAVVVALRAIWAIDHDVDRSMRLTIRAAMLIGSVLMSLTVQAFTEAFL